jgi:hypothetical protein
VVEWARGCMMHPLPGGAPWRHVARTGRELWTGLAVLRSLRDGSRVIGFVLVAVLA